jgi:hypothetical protein
MTNRVVSLALLVAHVTAADELLARAATIDAFFQNATAPDTWTVRSHSDLTGPIAEIYDKAKRVSRAHFKGRRVVVKTGGRHGLSNENQGAGVLYFELLYLEALRGEPGVPELMGAWVEDGNVTYVVRDCGQAIGAGTSGKPSILSTAYAKRAEHSPLELARALLACFQSFAANFLLDDFRVTQFTLDGKGHIYLVDGPKVLHNSSLGDQVYDVWYTRHNQEDNTVRNCASDGDCPATHRLHSCLYDVCEPGSLPAPEATGTCREKVCMPVSEKTHVFDARQPVSNNAASMACSGVISAQVSNRPWLLPFIADRARDWKTKKFLRSLIGEANRTLPEDRPSFAELVHRIDVFQRSHNFTAAPGDVGGGASFETAAVATTSCAHGRRGRKCRAKSGHH